MPTLAPPASRAALVACLLLVSACRASQEDIAAEPLGDGAIVAMFPGDGAKDLRDDVPIEVVLGADAVGTTPKIQLDVDGAMFAPSCELDYGGTYARCGAIVAADAADRLGVDVAVGGAAVSSAAITDPPRSIVGWDVFDGASVETFGPGTVARDQLAQALESSHAFGVLDGWAGQPGSYMFMVTTAAANGAGLYQAGTPGFTLMIPAEVDAAGHLTGEADTAWLTLNIRGEPVNVLMLDVALSGTLTGTELTDYRLEGSLPMVSLLNVADALDLGGVFVAAVGLDVDHDGDGENDAASLVFSGTPTAGQLDEWR